jgi:hypothetical protein
MELMFRRGDRYAWAWGIQLSLLCPTTFVCYRLGYQLQTWALILSKISRTLILHGISSS